MKGIIIAAIIVGAAAFGFYKFGGLEGYDPDKAGQEAKAAIKRGMTWEKVIETTTAPSKFRSIGFDDAGVQRVFGEQKFDRRILETKKREKGDYAPGFIFVYRYSGKTQFQVTFDGDGKVVSVSDMATASDLLGY